MLKTSIITILSLFLLGFGGGSAPDPFTLTVGNGEPTAAIPSPAGFSNANGYTLKSSVPAAPTTTAVIITVGQSNIESAASGTYTTTNTGSLNFNIYDGGTYACKNPVLGASQNSTGLGSNSANCQIADGLINASVYTSVIIVPTAIGGTFCSDWDTGGAINNRIAVTLARLKAAHLTPATGFTGDFWILWHQGESQNGTPTAGQVAACLQDIATLFVNAGTGTARFFIPQSESYVNGATQANVISGQSMALTGCSTCRAGANWDTLTTTVNRQADLTHFNATGAAAAAALDVTIITNCKHTAC